MRHETFRRMAKTIEHPPLIALNSGSSSLKFGIYPPHDASMQVLLSGEAETVGAGRSRFWVNEPSGKS